MKNKLFQLNFAYAILFLCLICSCASVKKKSRNKTICECMNIMIDQFKAEVDGIPKGCELINTVTDQDIANAMKDCPEIKEKVASWLLGEEANISAGEVVEHAAEPLPDEYLYKPNTPNKKIYEINFEGLSISLEHFENGRLNDMTISTEIENEITIDLGGDDVIYEELLNIKKSDYDIIEILGCYREGLVVYHEEVSFIEEDVKYSEWHPIKMIEKNKIFEISFEDSIDNVGAISLNKEDSLLIREEINNFLDINKQKELIKKRCGEWLYNEIKDCKTVDELPIFEYTRDQMILKIKLKKGNIESEKKITFYY